MEPAMYGVVLWSDNDDRKAVIWCEDHGDLAFYTGSGSDDGALDRHTLDAGDLVYFNVRQEQDMRMASKPQLVAEQQYPGLAEKLMAGGRMAQGRTGQAALEAVSAPSSNVVPFVPRGSATRLAS